MQIIKEKINSCLHCNFKSPCIGSLTSETSPTRHLVTRTRRFERNEALCVLNNKFRSIYIIKKGAVKAYQVDIHGHEHIHAFYFSGETLGYKAIYTGHYISNVVALTDTIVCEIEYNHFVESINTTPEFSKNVLALMSKQLNASTYIDMASAEQRIASFLIDLSLRMDEAIPMQELLLPMSRQDIGNYLRLTAETVSRILNRLHREQVIHTDRKLIRIINLERLQQLAQ